MVRAILIHIPLHRTVRTGNALKSEIITFLAVNHEIL